MKIGLLSYHKNYNYGWNLQCYALMTVLKSMGHDVVLIDKRKFRNSTVGDNIKHVAKTIYRFCHTPETKVSYEDEQKYKGRKIELFFEKYINPKSNVIINKKGYKSLPPFDAFVVGSDQVWRKKLVRPLADYFFNFVDYKTILISYAASFGVDYAEYSKEEIKYCGQLIKRFKAVSVREPSGVKLIKDVYKWNCNPVVMPDPTLLLSSHNYKEIINDYTTQNSGLFCYILDMDKDKEKVIEKISTTYSLNTHIINLNGEQIYPSIEEWLCSFRDAEFIFTDSFHGCVFSIIFRKPFIAYGNVKRGLARFISLLDTFSLRDRLINSFTDIEQIDLLNLRSIDKEYLDIIQNEISKKAYDFLLSELK